jgi:predicted nucleotidyltransferase
MQPPTTLDVLDEHGGFTAITTPCGNTLWRPGAILKRGTEGTLVSFDRHSFYQTNNNVTQAIYRVPGYRYRVAVWFDNATGRRIA